MAEKRTNALSDEYDPKACGLVMVLIMDVAECLRQEDSDFWRRMLIRSVFAFIEAYTTVLRRMVLEVYTQKEHAHIPLTKIALLQDYEYSVDEVGKVRRQTFKLVTQKQIALTLRTFAEVMGKDDDFIRDKVFGVNEWRNLKGSMKVRDRLTHPKRYEDLTITDDERHQCTTAFNWFVLLIGDLLKTPLEDTPPKFFYEEDDQGLVVSLSE